MENKDRNKRLSDYARLISEAVSIRKEKGITTQNISDETGIARPNVTRLETMTNEVKLSTLLAYLDALDCTLEIVPRGKKPRKKLPKIEKYDSLNGMSAKQFIRLVMYTQKLAGTGGLEIVPDDED